MPKKKADIKTKVEVNLKSVQDVDDLIKDLRDAKAKAKRTGGEYHIRRENHQGKVIFNIAFPHNECI